MLYHMPPISATTSKNSNAILSISIFMTYTVFVVLTKVSLFHAQRHMVSVHK